MSDTGPWFQQLGGAAASERSFLAFQRVRQLCGLVRAGPGAAAAVWAPPLTGTQGVALLLLLDDLVVGYCAYERGEICLLRRDPGRVSAGVDRVIAFNACSKFGFLWLVGCQTKRNLAGRANCLQGATQAVEGFMHFVGCVDELVGYRQVMNDIHVAVSGEEQYRGHRLFMGLSRRGGHSSSMPADRFFLEVQASEVACSREIHSA